MDFVVLSKEVDALILGGRGRWGRGRFLESGGARASGGGRGAGRGGGRGDGRRDGGCPNRGELVSLIILDSDTLDSGVVLSAAACPSPAEPMGDGG